MKHFFFLVAFFLIGKTASANNIENANMAYGYNNSFIFTEGPVEFAVYPDGSFDFYYLGRHAGNSVHIQTPNVNISFNAGYNYDPFVQYDDYGAVIQIENVPIFYDYYGRIIQAGNISIHYNHFGRIASIGGLYVHYNRYNHFTHYSGFINQYNPYYVYRPWHRYYMTPRPQYVIVYHTPYRMYYAPVRMDYYMYRDNPRKRNTMNFYRPGDNAVAYNVGRRTTQPRNLDQERSTRTNVATRTNETSPRSAVTSNGRSDTRSSANEAPRSNNRQEASAPARTENRTQATVPTRTSTRAQAIPQRETRSTNTAPVRTETRTGVPTRSTAPRTQVTNGRSTQQTNRVATPSRTTNMGSANSRTGR